MNAAKKMKSQFKVFSSDGECKIQMEGFINENTDFEEIRLADAKIVILDLELVRSLNSMGLRNWVSWVKTFRAKAQIFFRKCPRPVVDQMNILQGFLPMGAIVESFFVPYCCKSCDHEENFLATRGKDFMEGTIDAKEGMFVPATRPCPVCGAQMEWDVIPVKYFSFLKYRK
jgi:anti-anti-sigma regulatory factor